MKHQQVGLEDDFSEALAHGFFEGFASYRFEKQHETANF